MIIYPSNDQTQGSNPHLLRFVMIVGTLTFLLFGLFVFENISSDNSSICWKVGDEDCHALSVDESNNEHEKDIDAAFAVSYGNNTRVTINAVKNDGVQYQRLFPRNTTDFMRIGFFRKRDKKESKGKNNQPQPTDKKEPPIQDPADPSRLTKLILPGVTGSSSLPGIRAALEQYFVKASSTESCVRHANDTGWVTFDLETETETEACAKGLAWCIMRGVRYDLPTITRESRVKPPHSPKFKANNIDPPYKTAAKRKILAMCGPPRDRSPPSANDAGVSRSLGTARCRVPYRTDHSGAAVVTWRVTLDVSRTQMVQVKENHPDKNDHNAAGDADEDAGRDDDQDRIVGANGAGGNQQQQEPDDEDGTAAGPTPSVLENKKQWVHYMASNEERPFRPLTLLPAPRRPGWLFVTGYFLPRGIADHSRCMNLTCVYVQRTKTQQGQNAHLNLNGDGGQTGTSGIDAFHGTAVAGDMAFTYCPAPTREYLLRENTETYLFLTHVGSMVSSAVLVDPTSAIGDDLGKELSNDEEQEDPRKGADAGVGKGDHAENQDDNNQDDDHGPRRLPSQIPRVDLTVCTMLKLEGLHLTEWIAYHVAVGVTRFILYDNNTPQHPDRLMQRVLARMGRLRKGPAGFLGDPNAHSIVRIPWRHRHAQAEALNDCAARYGEYTKWMAFVDVDELLAPSVANPDSETDADDSDQELQRQDPNPPEGNLPPSPPTKDLVSVVSLLQSHPDLSSRPAIALPWVVFGPCSPLPNTALEIERCDKVLKSLRWVSKPVFQPSLVAGIRGFAPHHVLLHAELPSIPVLNPVEIGAQSPAPSAPRSTQGPFAYSGAPHIVLYHYRFHTWREFRIKRLGDTAARVMQRTPEDVREMWTDAANAAIPISPARNRVLPFASIVHRIVGDVTAARMPPAERLRLIRMQRSKQIAAELLKQIDEKPHAHGHDPDGNNHGNPDGNQNQLAKKQKNRDGKDGIGEVNGDNGRDADKDKDSKREERKEKRRKEKEENDGDDLEPEHNLHQQNVPLHRRKIPPPAHRGN
eukprot:TRINITY_DN2346_c0_g2_i1.p1 TRINITY_DN2346_c0_g2~~TRINITY_DN2346_c0_g2_i1.p1  ORF type:complete len:1036 (-),score=214.48 TRINITY_DN2346_c0_g2_i1:581-3688(-)